MGVSMGKHLGEHPAGFELFEDRCLYSVVRLPNGAMQNAMRQYVMTHKTTGSWGMKNTLAWKMFYGLEDVLGIFGQDLRVVVCHRTFMASVRARVEGRCPPGRCYSQGAAESWAIRAYMGMLAALDGLVCPVLHISYEDVLVDPDRELSRLAEFAHANVTDEARAHIRT
jgi:hypothetical protein